MRLTPGTIAAGTALYAAVAGSTYFYINSSSRAFPDEAGASHSCSCRTRFDRLAGCYDDKVGSEERVMLYGLMRWWLLRGLKGDVLEISAGTGRNLQHYPLDSLSSLTLTDTSVDMLQVAESKYYDELKLGYKQPQSVIKFLVSDAQHMVAQDNEVPVEAPLHRAVASATGLTHPPSHSASSTQARCTVATQLGSTASSAKQRLTAQQGEAMHGSNETDHSTTHYDSASSRGHEADHAGNAAGPQAPTVLTSIFSQLWRHSNTPADKRQPGFHNSYTRAAMPSGDSSKGTPSACIMPEPCAGVQSGRGSDESQSSSASRIDGEDRMLSKFKPHSFDAVVDTFGICSHEDPVLALREAAQLCRPGGRILLLEHGRSSWGWLNERMDAAAQKHFDKWGCWFNRDIISIVKDAGLEVESSSRWHFGTTYLMVARPPSPA